MNRNYPLNEKNNIITDEDNDLNDPCVQIEDLITVIKSAIKIHIFPLFFKKLYEYLDKIILRKYKNIAFLKFENEEILVNFNFEQKFENYYLKFSKYSENNKNFIKVTYSHWFLINEDNTNTYINNFKEIVSLNDLNEINFELKFNEGVRCFYYLQYERILSNLCLYESNELYIKYELFDNKIKCYLDKNYILFSLIIDNKGILCFIDESMNFTSNEKVKMLGYIKSLINCKNNIENSKCNEYYLYLYNVVLKKYFLNLPDCILNMIDDDYIFNVSLFDNLFFENTPLYRKNCSLRFMFEINKETFAVNRIKYFVVISIGKNEIVYDKKNEIYEIFNNSKIKFYYFKRIYEISQKFKKNMHTNIQILLEAISYGKIDIPNNFSTIIMNKIDLQISNDKEFLEFFSSNDYYERLEINLNRCLNFKIVLTTKFVYLP